MSAKQKTAVNYEAWAGSLIGFIRAKGLERELTDWCGGWKCPITPQPLGVAQQTVNCGEMKPSKQVAYDVMSTHSIDTIQEGIAEAIERERAPAQPPANCDCGFSADVCKTNPCMRKKMATSGLNPEAKYPYCGTPANPDAVEMYDEALDAANARIAELEAREWPVAQRPTEPVDITGWKLVPDQPTEAMWQAGRSADIHPGDSYSKVWSAMFDAAPDVDDCETTSSVSSTPSEPAKTVQHASDCSTNNAPALPVGPCDCGAWQPIETAPLDPLRDPPLVMLWVEDGGHKGEGTHAFGRCYRSYDGSVRGVASGFSGNWKIKYWKPLGPGPSLTSTKLGGEA